MKPNQQFIFATHNANFSVLGDSDQLASCELSENKIDLHIESIDNKVSQLKIVKVMEEELKPLVAEYPSIIFVKQLYRTQSNDLMSCELLLLRSHLSLLVE